ncbi:MAG: rRNA (adenine2503-C2)-methyltransferase [Clostridia bacterium]|nr:rRNA (adenine2503-C2)-methyltransferase [Clostridia bacterium]
MLDFRSLSLDELKDYVTAVGEKEFRARQIFSWIHKGAETFEEMTDLPHALREKLKKDGYLNNMEVAAKQRSKSDGTVKYLMALKDGNLIECVLMRYAYGNSLCISTQVGCNFGCRFCASTIGGKKRDLTAGEMLGQLLKVQRDVNCKINHVVLMGIGEPLDNFENVLKFLRIVNHPAGVNLGMRRITLSTCGLVPEIKRLADLNLQITLAVSLHAPNDRIRRQIMPVARKYGLEELLDACRYYISKTNRRITFEYALIDGVNDADRHAAELAQKLKGMLCHINLIPVNKISGRNYVKASRDRIESFKNILIASGIETTVRRELGTDIDAACGQLRSSHLWRLAPLHEP